MIDIFLLIILFVIGTIAIYQDVRLGKIRNKLILVGLLAGILGYALLATSSWFFSEATPSSFKKILINISISWIVSFFIWYAGFWSAGDAKIFMLFSFLLPLKYYGNSLPVPFFPAVILLINTFIFTMFFILLEMLLRIILESFNFVINFKAHKKDIMRDIYHRYNKIIDKIKNTKSEYLKIILAYLCFLMLFYIFQIYISNKLSILPLWQSLIFIIMIFAFRPIKKFLDSVKITLLYLFITLFGIYILFMVSISHRGYLLELGNMLRLRNFVGIALCVFLIFRILDSYLKKREEIKINASEISPRMVLSEETIRRINEYLKKEGSEERFYADGLTSQQAKYIKDLSLENPDFHGVVVYRTFPLAPFVFLGVLATIMARGVVFDLNMIVSFCRMIIGRFI